MQDQIVPTSNMLIRKHLRKGINDWVIQMIKDKDFNLVLDYSLALYQHWKRGMYIKIAETDSKIKTYNQKSNAESNCPEDCTTKDSYIYFVSL